MEQTIEDRDAVYFPAMRLVVCRMGPGRFERGGFFFTSAPQFMEKKTKGPCPDGGVESLPCALCIAAYCEGSAKP